MLADPRLGRYYLAESDGQVVGQLMTTFEWSDWRNGLFLWIQSVYVDAATPGRRRVPVPCSSTWRRSRARTPRICGIRLYVDRGNEKAQSVYGRLGMHRSNYGVMEDGLPRPGVPRGGIPMLKSGVEAPDFTLPDQDGQPRRLAGPDRRAVR